MCLILFAWQARARYRLVLAANRDEFYARPAAPMDWWPERPTVLAGRDLEAGGTWFGVTRDGRFAAVTNHRDPHRNVDGRPSRGALVADYLGGDAAPGDYLAALARRGEDYNGFNLLVGDRETLWYYGNRDGAPRPLAPGVYGLSNALLDTPWPKVRHGKHALATALAQPEVAPEALFTLLAERREAPDAELPATGVSLEWERRLSPLFIASEHYGTRCSTVLLLGDDGCVQVHERDAGDGAERGFGWRLG